MICLLQNVSVESRIARDSDTDTHVCILETANFGTHLAPGDCFAFLWLMKLPKTNRLFSSDEAEHYMIVLILRDLPSSTSLPFVSETLADAVSSMVGISGHEELVH